MSGNRRPPGRAARRLLAAGGIALALATAPAAAAPPASASATGRAGQAAASPIPVLAYYYLWFSHSSWNRAKRDYPLAGTYSSSDLSVMTRQIRQAKWAGISGFIVSWKDTALNDQRLRLLMRAAAQQHFKLAMIYQGLDFQRRPLPVAEVAADFVTFRDDFATSPVFFRIGGKPLTIWSGTWAFSHTAIARVTSAVRPAMLVLSTEKNAAGVQRVADITDGDAYYWSSVNPATNTHYASKLSQMSQAVHRAGGYWIAPFAPGFDARMVGGRKSVPRQGGRTLRTEYAAAVRSSPDLLGLISWNEFSENSYVEPSVRYRYQSLDVLRQLRGTTLPQPTGPAVASDAATGGPGGKVSTADLIGNLLRLAGFPIVLVLAAGLLGYVRRRADRRRTGRSLHRDTGQRLNTMNNRRA